MSADDKPTPLSQQAAEPIVEPPSWHGPVTELTGRVTKLEVAAVATNAKLDAIEKKTDAQTVMLGEIKGAVGAAAKNPWVRAFLVALALAAIAWLGKHGIKVEIPQ